MKGYPLGLPVSTSVYILHIYTYIYRTHCSLCLSYRPPTPKFLTWNICILVHFQNIIKIWTFSWSVLYSCILSYTLCSVLQHWAHSVVLIQLQVRVPNLSNKKFEISGASDCSFFAVQNNKKVLSNSAIQMPVFYPVLWNLLFGCLLPQNISELRYVSSLKNLAVWLLKKNCKWDIRGKQSVDSSGDVLLGSSVFHSPPWFKQRLHHQAEESELSASWF